MNPRVLLTPLLIATLAVSISSLSADEAQMEGFKKEIATLKAEVKAKFPVVAVRHLPAVESPEWRRGRRARRGFLPAVAFVAPSR